MIENDSAFTRLLSRISATSGLMLATLALNSLAARRIPEASVVPLDQIQSEIEG